MLDSQFRQPNNPPNLEPSLPQNVITDDLHQLLEMLPQTLQQRLQHHPQQTQLIEVVMDLGRLPEARFPEQADYLTDTPITRADLDYSIARVGHFSGDNRAGIERTLHRISAIRNRQGEIIGLTCRVGRAVFGTIGMIRDLVESGQSILLLGRPGVGKTTALREMARVLADDFQKRVVIIDTSNEIAGDGDVPHPAIGRARRMQVARPELQHQVMIEAVENHMPQVIVIDEIGTELEALAARTIAERGVQLIGTAHGNRIDNLIKNPTLSDLVGGIQSVTLGDDEARRRGSQKSVLERKAPPTFDIAVEMQERYRWVVHERVADTVDMLLRGRIPNPQIRTQDEQGKVVISHERAEPSLNRPDYRPDSRRLAPPLTMANPVDNSAPSGWRSTGQMRPPFTSHETGVKEYERDQQYFQELLDQSWGPTPGADSDEFDRPLSLTGQDLPLHVYPYAISRQQLEQVIQTLNLPIILTKDIDSADVLLALRAPIKHHAKLRHLARSRQIPIHVVKSGGLPSLARSLRRLLNMDEPGAPELADLSLLTANGSDDEIEALEEARLAVEQIVIPKGQPVELLPRNASIRKMQHELIEHYRLNSQSFGEEPNRRLRIYPA
jgi:stage III sporulation protein SpoIIIAA